VDELAVGSLQLAERGKADRRLGESGVGSSAGGVGALRGPAVSRQFAVGGKREGRPAVGRKRRWIVGGRRGCAARTGGQQAVCSWQKEGRPTGGWAKAALDRRREAWVRCADQRSVGSLQLAERGKADRRLGESSVGSPAGGVGPLRGPAVSRQFAVGRKKRGLAGAEIQGGSGESPRRASPLAFRVSSLVTRTGGRGG